MKYLDEFFVPYDSYFETNILLASKSCILNIFLFLQKLLLLVFLSSKFMVFPPIFILSEKKNVKKKICNNLSIL